MAKKKKSKGKNKSGFFGVVIALIIVLVAVYVGYRIEPQNQESPTGNVVAETTDADAVLVTVNGEVITQATLDERYNELPVNIQAYVTKDSLLEELIDEILLNQEADKYEIAVSDEEVEAEVDKIGEQQSLTREEMDSILQQQGQSLDSFKEELRSQLRLQKLFDEAVETPEITEEEIQSAYEQLNSVKVRHILLAKEENETDEEFDARTQELFSMIEEDKSNYCELVAEYTLDTASVETCGEYEVYEGSNFVPEFETAALEMEIDEVMIVQSQYGAHIMWKTEITPLEDVREGIVQTLELGSSREALTNYLASLRENANIFYPGDEVMEDDFQEILEEEPISIDFESLEELNETNEEAVSDADVTFSLTGVNYAFFMDEKEAPELEVLLGQKVRIEFTSTDGFHDWVVDEFDAATEKVQTDGSTFVEFVADEAGTFEYYCSVGQHRANGMVGNLVVVDPYAEVVEETPVEEVPEELVEEPEEEYVSIDEVADDSLLSCLEDNSVELYGAYWDSQTKKQLQLFEGEVPFYVECFQPGSFRNKNAVCEDVQAYPTWNIDGEQILGYMSLNSLRSLTGC